jgi:hypothetical protein
MKIFLTALAIIALVAVVGIRMMSPGGFLGFKYESTAVVQVHPSMLAIAPSTNSSTDGGLMTRHYMESEFETSAEEMISTAAALELPENQVSILYTQYLETLRESQKLAAQGLAEDHPSRVALTTQANELMGNAKKAVISLKEVLNTRLNLVDRQVERMKLTILNKKEISNDRTMRQHEYNSAKEEYEQSRDLLREMKIQQQEQRALLKRPRQAVTRHE